MKEDLLHFIWKLQLFVNQELVTNQGETVQVISTGVHNTNSGPDFLNAKLKIGNQLWAGNVEIHINSSDWYAHHHEKDDRYSSVILHIVFTDDVPVFTNNNQLLPTLELKKFISTKLLDAYNQLFSKEKKWIFCESNIHTIDDFSWMNWLERLYIQRLQNKTDFIFSILQKSCNDWEATLFTLLAKNFGLKLNGEAFYQMATSFSFSIVRKESHQLTALEALFFGQSGLLADNKEFLYYKKLKTEYEYLQKKYSLKPINENQMQFFRLRPANFPTIRLSQFAMLYHKNQQLFSQLMNVKKTSDFYRFLKVETSDFWKTHYTFDKESKSITKKLSNSFIDLLIINTIIPLKFAYEKSLGKSDFSHILEISQQLKPEKNKIIAHFNELKIESNNAFETQALLQLKNEMCNHQKCLQCAVGKELLK